MIKLYTLPRLLFVAAGITALSPSAIAKRLEVTVTEAGTLTRLLTNDQKKNTTDMKVSGPLNGTDLRLLREMSGVDYL